jgi:hypothetical protein
MGVIDKSTIEKTIKALITKYGEDAKFRAERGVKQVAAMWMEKDGTTADFEKYCMDNFMTKGVDVDRLFRHLSTNYEILNGHFNKIILDLNRPLHLSTFEKDPVDELFGAYNPAAHLSDDFFSNKFAFLVLLNFPHYTLAEKTERGENWTRKQWAFARVGDIFTSRVPGEILLKVSQAITASDTYISDYNIFVGNLVDDKGATYFPKDMKLLSHWNLRDELKAQYSKPDGLVHQKMIYDVMLHIINQTIPENVINKDDVQWNPIKNVVLKDGKEVASKPEPNTRYAKLLNNFKALRDVDKYSPQYPTFIDRKFEEEFELPQKEVEEYFTKFVSSPTIKKAGELIAKRLGRKLEAFDIWYDGFKARSSISDEVLTAKTMAKYPNPEAYKKDLPNILKNLGFSAERADFISSKIDVDPARGSGHAWGAEMKSENAHLRTRVGEKGMDYKGYNIATHELGHNVEQTITLQDVDFYMMRGVPNTAFTEAWAFIFQKRDLELLGMKENDPNKTHLLALDNLWSCYEIMGVSLVDMAVWKWLYANPTATPEQLKEQVVKTAKEVWNKYYANVFGVKDSPILAIYSHMIDNPLYLSAYPIGHLIEFQMDKYMTGKNVGDEMQRMLKQGRLIPQSWMMGAVGAKLSIQPTLDAAEEAMKVVN